MSRKRRAFFGAKRAGMHQLFPIPGARSRTSPKHPAGSKGSKEPPRAKLCEKLISKPTIIAITVFLAD